MSLLADLERLEELHRELRSQARVVLGLVEQGEEEALDDAWARRQQVFRELSALHDRLAPVLERWEETAAALAPAQQERAQEIFEQVQRLGQEVLELDQRASRLLEDRRSELRQDLGRLKAGQRLQEAYGGSRRWWGPDRLSRIG